MIEGKAPVGRWPEATFNRQLTMGSAPMIVNLFRMRRVVCRDANTQPSAVCNLTVREPDGAGPAEEVP